MSEDTGQKLEIDWLKTIAGALAAVSSAVLLSTLGAAGTLIGAALGSVIATVGGALYTQGLATSRAQLARAQETARLKVGIAQAELRRANRQQGNESAVEAHLSHAEERLDEARDDLDALAEEPERSTWRERLGALPWKRISLVAAGLFAAALVAITAFELATGESVSSMTGGTDDGDGTTISRIGGGSDKEQPKDEPPADEEQAPVDEPTEEPSAEPSVEPSDEPSDAPSEQPSEEPTSVPTLPSGTPEPTAPAPSVSE